MTFSYSLFYDHAGDTTLQLSDADRSRFVEIVRATPGLRKALIYTPERATDPHLDDGPPPPLAAQLYFADIDALEDAVARDGHLQALAVHGMLPSLAGARITQQAMLNRTFAVPDPVFRTAPGELPCSYLVTYPGPAEDLNEWLAFYLAHHPAIMAKLPAIRELEVLTRIDWCGFLPWPRANAMLRNRVAFDSPGALTAALASSVRHELRADYKLFPPFRGGNTHHPMATLVVTP
ncbi:MAG: hypothetical protein LJE97_16830 [Betaproteobacteria bacterium]|nr:hypothetical protein [Betaproteobacteria bacterium]